MKLQTVGFIAILFVIIVLFSILGQQQQEGFSEAVPTCGDAENDYGTVPACYSTIQPSDKLFYGPDNLNANDAYILKTKVLPPFLGSCNDGFDSKNLHGSNVNEDQRIDTPDSNTVIPKYDPSANTLGNLLGSDLNVIKKTDSKASDVSNGYTLGVDMDNLINMNKKLSDQLMQAYTMGDPNQVPAPSPSNKQENFSEVPKDDSHDNCPPCPACQRCPEPVVDCKKVINYRNPDSASQIPLPVLNSFSSF
jgi:hypothetical protein